MQNAETVLGVIREHGKHGKPLERIYRLLYNEELYLRAYANLYSNKGAMTPGSTRETVDGMSLAKIRTIIQRFRIGTYRWDPTKRVYIPKKDGRQRPLGLPTWSDKLVQEVLRQILEAYYEPQFSDHSHGFRPGRGCHTALREIEVTGKGTTWFIEGDIKQCFDTLDHGVMIDTLREKIHDNRFLDLIGRLLEAGYMEEWKWNATHSGSPQGGVISPILANIYLDRLDTHIETVLFPEYNKGKERARNPEYRHLEYKAGLARKKGNYLEAEAIGKQMRQLPYGDTHDPNYRRLRYVRYADDFLLLLAGTRTEAEEIKGHLGDYLSNTLKLELSQNKTLVTHAGTGAAQFLGYEIRARYEDSWLDSNGERNINGAIALRLPEHVLDEQCARYKRGTKPIHRPELLQNSDYEIVARYQSEYRGVVQYYLLAQNVHWLNKLRWVMATSLLKTLAGKHKTTVNAMVRKYQATAETPHGQRKCLRVVVEREGKKPLAAQFGGIPLRHSKVAQLNDQKPLKHRAMRTELVTRLVKGECEMCGGKAEEVHHIRKLADLNRPGRAEKPLWIRRMAALRRKTMVVCETCHDDIHGGDAPGRVRKLGMEIRRAG